MSAPLSKSDAPAAHAVPSTPHPVLVLLPGLALAGGLVIIAYALRAVLNVGMLSPLVVAIFLGMAFHNVIGTPKRAVPGVKFAMRRILRGAIVLLGLQLTFTQVRTVGLDGMAIVMVTLVATFFVTRWLGRLVGVDAKLSELIAAGTAICGASAVIATNTVTRASDEDATYAVACVTVFGSLSMFLYPVIAPLTGFDAHAYGLWAGSSIHEIAQVVAAAFQQGQSAGEFGTIAKLNRVILLAPLVLGLGFFATRKARAMGTGGKVEAPPVPWFILGFLAMIVVNSSGIIPATATPVIATVTTVLLAVALAAMGLETDVRKLKARGWRPLALGTLSWLFISVLSFGLIWLSPKLFG
ncbi:membrane protein [Azorhizobium oxalatiphilum]|uniref:Membrane protein n=1 Tax=Azorhizobium oxalatiphilum TaxID=980631 RepID=A0A917BKY1_9HYPH|nr:YeiH family protein [Azorhizobium oxalatiphilum]GGF48134.1 membrane protein [Azorhizobium oxalatiphilum]